LIFSCNFDIKDSAKLPKILNLGKCLINFSIDNFNLSFSSEVHDKPDKSYSISSIKNELNISEILYCEFVSAFLNK